MTWYMFATNIYFRKLWYFFHGIIVIFLNVIHNPIVIVKNPNTQEIEKINKTSIEWISSIIKYMSTVNVIRVFINVKSKDECKHNKNNF
jgi:hypothetical protein